MGNLVNFRSLTVNLIVFLGMGSEQVNAQFTPVDSLIVNDKITAFSKDRSENFFLAFDGGAITKYNSSLDSIISFSPIKLGDITLLEAGHGFQIFAFYEDFQEYAILDRFLTRDTRYTLSQTSSNYVDICTFSRDQNIWAFEENQIKLVKINLSIRQLDIEVPLEFIIDAQDHQISFVKEYQNLVFLVDENSGIYIFDNLGNYLRKVDAQGVKQCSFSNDQLFFIAGNTLHILDLYKDRHQLIKLKENNYLGAIAMENYILLVTPTKILRLPAGSQ